MDVHVQKLWSELTAFIFQVSSGAHRRREPMEGEVVWLPHFALPIEESSNRKERERLQMQFLYDAWRYMNEEDDDVLETLEQELENPNHRRWQSWFDEAKRLKTKKQKARRKRASHRRELVQQALIHDPTISIEDIDINGDTTADEDSAYDSDEQTPIFVSGASRSKRKSGPDGKAGPSSKKSKKSGPGGNGGGFMGTPPMGSGGLGSPDRDDPNRPQPNFNLGPSLTRSGATSSSSRSPGKRLSDTQRWRDDQASRQVHGNLDDDEALNSAIRASIGPEDDDPATNVNTQND